MSTSATVTPYKHVSAAQAFINEMDNTDHPIFAFAGKATSWNTAEDMPPDVSVSMHSEKDIIKNLVFAKPLTSADTHLCIKRYDWIADKVYTEWSFDNNTLYPDKWLEVDGEKRPVYVCYDDGTSISVFLCISNNKGGLSTQSPGIIMPGETKKIHKTYRLDKKTTDGYIWKWLFDVSKDMMFKWGSEYYIPVPINDEEKTPEHKNVMELLKNQAHLGEIMQINVNESNMGEIKMYVDEKQYSGDQQIMEGTLKVNSDYHVALNIEGDGMGCLTSVTLEAAPQENRPGNAAWGTIRAKGGIDYRQVRESKTVYSVELIQEYKKNNQGEKIQATGPDPQDPENTILLEDAEGNPIWEEYEEHLRPTLTLTNLSQDTINNIINAGRYPITGNSNIFYFDSWVLGDAYTTYEMVPKPFCYIIYRIKDINVVKSGTGYSYANITVRSIDNETVVVTQPSFSMKINPEVLLGLDPVKDICARWITFRVTFTGDEEGVFPLSVKYRQVGLVRNLIRKNKTYVNNSVNLFDTLYVDNVTKEFVADTVLEGIETTVKANIVYAETQSNQQKLLLTNRTGTFYSYADQKLEDNEIVEVVTYKSDNSMEIISSGRIKRIETNDVLNTDGDVIYIENLPPTDRRAGQQEVFLLTIEL